MKPERIKSLLPHASKSFIDLNANSGPQGSEPKRAVRDGPLAAPKGEAGNSGRYGVSVTSYRVRSVDPDNLCAKYFVDSLRYAGILPDDTEADIVYQISQKKVAKKAQEKTLIQITWPS